jgi:hypothetical protein
MWPLSNRSSDAVNVIDPEVPLGDIVRSLSANLKNGW